MVDSIFRKLGIRETPEIRRVRWFDEGPPDLNGSKIQRRGMILYSQKKRLLWGPIVHTIQCSDGVIRKRSEPFWAIKR